MTDNMLVVKLKKGDLDAFRMIFSKYKTKVFYFACSYLKSKDKAQDIVQDVFTKVWEKRECLEEHYSFNSYLFTITKNVILNIIRKTKYEIEYRENLIELSASFDYQLNNTLDSVLCNDLKSYINAEIENLPPAMSRIYKLSRIQLLSNEEIADSQNLSIRTVENHIIAQIITVVAVLISSCYLKYSLDKHLFYGMVDVALIPVVSNTSTYAINKP